MFFGVFWCFLVWRVKLIFKLVVLYVVSFRFVGGCWVIVVSMENELKGNLVYRSILFFCSF